MICDATTVMWCLCSGRDIVESAYNSNIIHERISMLGMDEI